MLENVPFMLQLAKGEAMEVVVQMFEHLGYRWAFRVIDSRVFGVPQRRKRVIMVASLNEDPKDVLFADDEPPRGTLEGKLAGRCMWFYWTEGSAAWAGPTMPFPRSSRARR